MPWQTKQMQTNVTPTRTHLANLREQRHGQSRKSAKHPKTCEKHGGPRKTARGVRTLLNKKHNVSHEVNRDLESTDKNECAYVQLFLRIMNLKRSNKKILQRIEKQSHRFRNYYVSTSRECSRQSKKAHKHWTSPDTSSQTRQVKKTGNRISKINSDLNN